MIAAGRLVDDALFASRPPEPPADVFRHSVKLKPVEAECFKVRSGRARTTVIDSQEGILLTGRLTVELRLVDGVKYADPGRDVLKLAVLARHGGEPRTGLGFVHGFGIRNGALASSVGHDSHNLCVVGANDGDMAVAVNALIECGGGFVAVENGKVLALLPLEIGGLISAEPFADHAAEAEKGDRRGAPAGLPVPRTVPAAFLPAAAGDSASAVDRPWAVRRGQIRVRPGILIHFPECPILL